MSQYIKILPVNTLGRDFVIGDIHGCLEQLDMLMKHVGFNKTVDRLIAVGDLVDRGPNSYAVLKLLRQPWFHSVLGNHEIMMAEGLRNSFYLWKRNGGDWFFALSEEEQKDVSLDLVINYVDYLPWMITVELPGGKRFHVLHAELEPKVDVTDANLEEVFLEAATAYTYDGPVIHWGRHHFINLCGPDLTDRQLRKQRRHCELHSICNWMTDELSDIYVGHTPMKAPVRLDKLVNLDTHAYNLYDGRYKKCGLTMTEPLTGKFWTATNSSVEEVKCWVVPDIGDCNEV